MNGEGRSTRPTRPASFRPWLYWSYALFCGVVLIGTVLGAELILRHKGERPYARYRGTMQEVVPGGRLFQKHATLGYRHLPGRYEVRFLEQPPFVITHGDDTLRITSPPSLRTDPRPREGLWVFGCSFTHGWSVNDDETYCWKLQEAFPEYEVVNFGVSGYGTLHGLIQFREALKERDAPKVAIIAYAGFHDGRNTFLRGRRKQVVTWSHLGPLVQPYGRLNGAGELEVEIASVVYREFPLMRRSALVHWLEKRYNEWEHRHLDSHAVSEAIVRDFASLARSHDVVPVVATLGRGPADARMRDFARAQGILSVDIRVPRKSREVSGRRYRSHPGPVTHAEYAQKLTDFLRATVFADETP